MICAVAYYLDLLPFFGYMGIGMLNNVGVSPAPCFHPESVRTSLVSSFCTYKDRF